MVTSQAVRRTLRVRRGLICLLSLTLYLGFGVRSAQAQRVSAWGPKYARPERPVNLFAQWDASVAFDAIRISLPSRWQLVAAEEVDASRMNRTPLSLRRDGNDWIAEGPSRFTAPLRIVVTATPQGPVGGAVVKIEAANLDRIKKDVLSESVANAVRLDVPVEEARQTSGHALRLREAAKLQNEPDWVPSLVPATESFTTEFWFQTVDRDVILLSTWDGQESGSYPFEFVVDAGGNLRCYSGQGGMHYSVVSDRPLADGSWHHVAYVRDMDAHVASLYVDGKATDSVYLPDETSDRSYPIWIGGRISSTSSKLDGLFDELRVWTKALSSDVIAKQTRLPGRSLTDRPAILLDFESSLPESVENDDSVLSVSDLALHEPVQGARAEVKSGGVEIDWRLTGAEAQTVTLERSEDGTVFVPIYLVVAAARDPRQTTFDRSYSFQDLDVTQSSVFYYRFTQDYKDGSRLVSNTLKVGLGEAEQPATFNLIGNSPNPFVSSTQIFFDLTEPMHVRLSVWDISGHLVEWLIDQQMEAGSHQVQFVADEIPSGTYFVRMESDQGAVTRKMILRK